MDSSPILHPLEFFVLVTHPDSNSLFSTNYLSTASKINPTLEFSCLWLAYLNLSISFVAKYNYYDRQLAYFYSRFLKLLTITV